MVAKVKIQVPEDLVEKLKAKLEKIGHFESLWLEVKDKVFCGKSRCKKCGSGSGHKGPYYYLHFRANGKNKTIYLGRSRSSRLVTLSYDKLYRKTPTVDVDAMLAKYCSTCPLYKNQGGRCEYLVKGFCGAVKFANFLKQNLRGDKDAKST